MPRLGAQHHWPADYPSNSFLRLVMASGNSSFSSLSSSWGHSYRTQLLWQWVATPQGIRVRISMRRNVTMSPNRVHCAELVLIDTNGLNWYWYREHIWWSGAFWTSLAGSSNDSGANHHLSIRLGLLVLRTWKCMNWLQDLIRMKHHVRTVCSAECCGRLDG